MGGRRGGSPQPHLRKGGEHMGGWHLSHLQGCSVPTPHPGGAVVSAGPQGQQWHNPGIIARICFFSFPGLGGCSRKGPSAV